MGSSRPSSILDWRFQFVNLWRGAPDIQTDEVCTADGWNRDATPMTKGEYGRWEVTLPNKDGQTAIPHNSKVKVRVAKNKMAWKTKF